MSYSLRIVSSRFLLVVGRFRSFLARCRSFQVVSGCSRFSKYALLDIQEQNMELLSFHNSYFEIRVNWFEMVLEIKIAME